MGQQAQRTARRRKLGAALKDARVAAGVTVAEAAKVIGGDNSKVSRVENGRHRITQLELNALMDLCGVKQQKAREWLTALASEERKKNWWTQYHELLPGGFKETLLLESDAARIEVYQAEVVPGLLQTPDYARTVMAGAPYPPTDEQLDFYVKFRMERQRVFEREDPPQYICIMPEGVLHQQMGSADIMGFQLRRLVAACRSPYITIRVVPFTRHPYTCTGGSFNVYSYPGPMDLEVVHVPHLDGELYLEDDEAVAKYRRVFQNLQVSALSAQQSIELMTSIANDLEREARHK
ncbi:helix-turn-helix domain-containing protein [Streptomyces rectiverticillatus]|uniref:helix-turn-helix domain-containing protein n=1 Tax=Streptomyces rectiverticillatus TaxID=173860 RepID=UPI0015C35AF1|nr:helix-turn-helix transcriptional regulator [Streptomyces rectiverticillatus]